MQRLSDLPHPGSTLDSSPGALCGLESTQGDGHGEGDQTVERAKKHLVQKACGRIRPTGKHLPYREAAAEHVAKRRMKAQFLHGELGKLPLKAGPVTPEHDPWQGLVAGGERTAVGERPVGMGIEGLVVKIMIDEPAEKSVGRLHHDDSSAGLEATRALVKCA